VRVILPSRAVRSSARIKKLAVPNGAEELFNVRDWLNDELLCRKLLINTRLQPGAKGLLKGKNRLNGFSWARSRFTALKRGVNEMISTEQ
jgi:hypothetical protein